jgi:hypothetical protein
MIVDTVQSFWNFLLHSAGMHLKFAIIIILTTLIAALIHWLAKKIPHWQYILLEIISGVLLILEVTGFVSIVIFELASDVKLELNSYNTVPNVEHVKSTAAPVKDDGKTVHVSSFR